MKLQELTGVIYQTEYKAPPWAETVLIVCMAIGVACLAMWLVCESIRRLAQIQLRIEARRNHQESKALDNWQRAFEAEKADHINDVAELRNQIFTLEKDNQRMKRLLAGVKVSEMGGAR